MDIANLEGDLWIVSQIGRSSDIRLSSNPLGLISSDNRSDLKFCFNGSIKATFTELCIIKQSLPQCPIMPPILLYHSWATSLDLKLIWKILKKWRNAKFWNTKYRHNNKQCFQFKFWSHLCELYQVSPCHNIPKGGPNWLGHLRS